MSERLRFHNKVVVITGGGRGIGEGCVRVFAREGGNVVFCDKRKEEGEKLQEEVNNEGLGKALFIECDVTIARDIEKVVETAVEHFGAIHCLLNNVGWHPPRNPIDDVDEQGLRDLLELNVISYFNFCKKALPYLRQTKGSVINMSSMANVLGQKQALHYCMTKGAISAMTRSLAIDEARHGVRVNTVSPSCVWTPLFQEYARASGDYDKVVQAGKDFPVLGRIATVEEVGEACLFLATEGSICTGIDLPLSGGAELGFADKNQTQEGRAASS